MFTLIRRSRGITGENIVWSRGEMDEGDDMSKSALSTKTADRRHIDRRSAVSFRCGGAEGTRTPDPCDANAMLSQLSYSPTS